jgi:myo-inositol-1(or 4)-monophosphatase
MTDPALAVAVRAARNAAAVIEDAARDLKRLPGFSREHAEIAASASTEAEAAMATALSAGFPDHAIVGEEGTPREGRNAESSWRWIVDPIDGTRNFAHGYPHYAISLALMHGSEPTHAVVFDPLRDELFTAVKARGAQLNGVQLRVSSCTRIEDALIATVFPARRSSKLGDYLPRLNTLMQRCAGVRRAGAGALDLAWVAAGRLDGFWVMSIRSSDIAAGALLVREAGGRVGDLAGATEQVKSTEIIAAAPGVFAALRETLAASATFPAAASES